MSGGPIKNVVWAICENASVQHLTELGDSRTLCDRLPVVESTQTRPGKFASNCKQCDRMKTYLVEGTK